MVPAPPGYTRPPDSPLALEQAPFYGDAWLWSQFPAYLFDANAL